MLYNKQEMIARVLAGSHGLQFGFADLFPTISVVLLLLATALLLYRDLREKYRLRSQRQWADTLDSFGDCILVHDDAFRIIKVNRALLQRLGRESAAVLNRPCEAVLPRLQQRLQCAKRRRQPSVQGKTPSCEGVERGSVAPVEGEETARPAGSRAPQTGAFDDDRLDPAAAQEISDRGADHAAPANQHPHRLAYCLTIA